MISFQPSENNFEMKVQNSYHRYSGATMHFSEARHSEGNIRALRKSQPLIKGDPSCWTDIRLHKRLMPNFGVSYFHLCQQILSKAKFIKLRPCGFLRFSKNWFNQSQYRAAKLCILIGWTYGEPVLWKNLDMYIRGFRWFLDIKVSRLSQFSWDS